ncbi:hypothetical protein CEXT_396001 [Caerostris extrusa]|uniref:Uncharacterized protein n=1 Tax=Caerostris extrusa TaxID=172846 RepID=A0AAV4VMP9_CAEEX|nr:hypothetical protein CEXT_396001 [Caerostris extrusa]
MKNVSHSTLGRGKSVNPDRPVRRAVLERVLKLILSGDHSRNARQPSRWSHSGKVIEKKSRIEQVQTQSNHPLKWTVSYEPSCHPLSSIKPIVCKLLEIVI